MKNPLIKHYILIITFLCVSIVFATISTVSTAEFLIFLFSGILIGINIFKIKEHKIIK